MYNVRVNAAHLHLIVNHFPVVGSFITALALAFGLWKKSGDVKKFGLSLAIFCALAGAAAYLTGEPAEETIEHIPGVQESMIEEHEESALWVVILLSACGAGSAAGLWFSRRGHQPSFDRSVLAALVLSLFALAAAGRTAYLGGIIRHDEIQTNDTSSVPSELQP